MILDSLSIVVTYLVVSEECPVASLQKVQLWEVEFGKVHTILSSVSFSEKTAPANNKRIDTILYIVNQVLGKY